MPIVEDACEALGGVYADGGPIGGRGHPAVFAFYANKQMTTGEGGMVVGRRRRRSRSASTPSATRAARPNMDWLDHDRLGFNYRLSDIACALGPGAAERLDELLAGRERVAGLYREALQEIPEVTLPCENAGQARARLVRVRDPAAAWGRPRCGRDAARRARDRGQAVLPGDPPDELLPGDLRLPRGPVPGLRGRRGALDRDPVLPADERGPGRARRRGARGRASQRAGTRGSLARAPHELVAAA